MKDALKLKLGLGIILAVALIAGYYGCGGSSSSDSGSSAAYEALGITDTAFGTLGVVTTTIGVYSDIKRIARQSDGKIVAGGTATYGNSNFALARYTITGTLDTSFDTDGIVTTTIGTNSDIRGMALQTDGKIVACGPSDNVIALARYEANGALDTSFGTGGVTTTAIGTTNYANDLTIQSNGKIVIGCASHDGSNWRLALARYTITGTLDTSFGTNGVITTAFGTYTWLYRITLLADNKILATGTCQYGSDYPIFLARYTADGALDTTFSTDGVITHTINAGGNDDGAMTMALQSDGKILTAGWAEDIGPLDYNNFVARYTAAGALDTSFSSDGAVTMSITSPITFTDIESYGMGLQSNGKIVVAGYAYTSTSYFMLARYTSSGTIDTSFGGGDGVMIDLLGSTNSCFEDMLIQPDGYIVAAGYADYVGNNHFAIVRFK